MLRADESFRLGVGLGGGRGWLFMSFMIDDFFLDLLGGIRAELVRQAV